MTSNGINQNGQNYEIHFGPLADQADINQLKQNYKTINGQPVIVYTYKTNKLLKEMLC